MKKTTSGYRHGACAANCGTLVSFMSLGAACWGGLLLYAPQAQIEAKAWACPLVAMGLIGLLGGISMSKLRSVLKCTTCGTVVARE